MGECFPVFMFQEWCPLYSASLVQSPQEQDAELQEANNIHEEHFHTESSLLGGEQKWRSKTLVIFHSKKKNYCTTCALWECEIIQKYLWNCNSYLQAFLYDTSRGSSCHVLRIN